MVPKKILVMVVLILLLGAIIGGGVLAYRSIQNKPKASKPTPTQASIKPTSTPTPIATPTPVEISLSDYKIQVLNGSGAPGVAGAVRVLLDKEGAKDVATDNADAYDYKDTEIQLKKEVGEKVFAKLKEILIDFSVVKGDILPKTSSYDIVITLGTKTTP